jgi:hypothetical protein
MTPRTGSSCRFVPFCDGWAYKFYACQEKRDRCRNYQAALFLAGLAPLVRGDVTLLVENGFPCRAYGYITEIVEPDRGDAPLSQVVEIVTRLERMGIYAGDLLADSGYRPHNFGRKNGRLVVVDFSEFRRIA